MPILFDGPVGRVFRLPPGAGEQATFATFGEIKTDDAKWEFNAYKSLVMKVTMALETSQQFLHTFGGDIYVYVFGDRIGQMTIGGLSFAWNCSSSTAEAGDVSEADLANPDRLVPTWPNNAQEHGIEKLLQWYNTNKLSRRRTPIVVTFGKSTVSGYVIGFNMAVNDFKAMVMEYAITLALIPPAQTITAMPAVPATRK